MISLQSLRARLGLLLALSFGLIVGLTVYWSFQDQVRRLAEAEASELRLARQVASSYGQIFRRAREAMTALAEIAALRDPRQCAALLASLLPRYPQYSNLFVADPAGKAICGNQPQRRAVSVKDYSAFAQAVATLDFAVGDLENSRFTEQVFLAAALPVLDAHGAPLALLMAIMDLEYLNNAAAQIALPPGGSITLFDRTGRIVARQPDADKWLGDSLTATEMFIALGRGDTRWDGVAADGTRRHFALAAVDGVPAPAELYVSIGSDPEMTLAPVRAALYRGLALFIVVALLAFLVAWFAIERSVIRRLNALVAATRRLASGDLSARASMSGGPSELRQLGSAFDDMAAALQERYRERHRAEENRKKLETQLRQAQKMEAMGTLAGGIAHDFNNILAAILGNLQLARQDIGPHHPAEESLAEIDRASKRARDLVQQILAFSRRQTPERHVVRLSEVVEDALKLLRATLPAGIDWATAFAADTPNVLADRTQIQQVLMNLCANAWHAMEGKPGRIEIMLAGVVVNGDAIRVGLPPGRYARLSVTDSGKGMDAATLPHIFDPFFTTKPVGQGTGLGLSVVDGIVKSHEGAVAAYSEPGRGSVFHLYFPAAQAEAAALPQAPSSLPCGNGQRILYLDDEEPLVQLATRLLGRQGYAVNGYTRAAEALAAFRDDPAGFDIVVTDYNMPGASGLDVAREALRLRPELPVALISGYVTDELRAQARMLGIREVIYKSNTAEDLAAAVCRVLTGQGQPK